MIKQVFYFSPHQDDELTNLGAAVCADLEQGLEVFCVLCTDGGASCARKLLADGSACAWHDGRHDLPLSKREFIAARDREFTASCLALGVEPDHVIIPPFRAPDGGCTPAAAELIILNATTACSAQHTAIKTLAPVTRQRQNPDHTAIALAAAALFAERRFAALQTYYEMILLPAPDGVPLQKLTPSPQGRVRLLRAAAEYGRWEPENGRYAIGRHSVYDEFEAFRREPCAWLVQPENSRSDQQTIK